MSWCNIPSVFIKAFFLKIGGGGGGRYICVFEYIGTLHSFPKIYFNIPFYEIK